MGRQSWKYEEEREREISEMGGSVDDAEERKGERERGRCIDRKRRRYPQFKSRLIRFQVTGYQNCTYTVALHYTSQ